MTIDKILLILRIIQIYKEYVTTVNIRGYREQRYLQKYTNHESQERINDNYTQIFFKC